MSAPAPVCSIFTYNGRTGLRVIKVKNSPILGKMWEVFVCGSAPRRGTRKLPTHKNFANFPAWRLAL